VIRSRERDRDPDSAYWDEVEAEWSGAGSRSWRIHSDALNRVLLRRWLPPGGGRLLKTDLFDEAVGEGLVGGLAAEWRVVGTDLGAGVVRAARDGRPDLAAVVCDVRALPFREGAFDAIVSNSTLDHFPRRDDLERAVAGLARALVPSGRLVLSLDNPRNPLVAFRNALPFRWLRALRLVPYYIGVTLGPRDVARTLESAGLEGLELDALLHVPRAPVVGLCGLLDRLPGSAPSRLCIGVARAFEVFGRLPTRFLTGHYVAALAVRPTPAVASSSTGSSGSS